MFRFNFIILILATNLPAHADMTKARKAMEDQNFEAAFSQFLISAKKGNIYAQYIIAQMYARGDGVTKDIREAASWYSLSADAGHLQSQNNLANMYMDGYGVLQNLTEAARWFERAAEQGNYLSMASLAELYQHGDGVELDFDKALDLYLTSAEKGIGKSMNNLGFMHFKGHGVPQSYINAYMWFTIAEKNGHLQGKVNKFDMLAYISEEDQLTATEMADLWLLQYPVKKKLDKN